MSRDFVSLRCPECLGKFDENTQTLCECRSCGSRFSIVDGIPVLAQKPTYFGEFTQQEMNQFLTDACEDLEATLRRWIRTKQFPAKLGEYILGSGRAGWKYLLPVDCHATVLDLGCGWGAISYSLAQTCRLVVATDTCLERMKFLKLRTSLEKLTNIQYVCTGQSRFLPFEEGTFDLVVVNGVLEWVPTTRSGNPRDVQRDFLREIARVLKPSGVLWLAIENRYAWRTWFRCADGHTGLRFVTWLPRTVADLVSRIYGRGPYRTYLYGRKELENLLKESGFSETRLFVLLPGYHHPVTVVPIEERTKIASYYDRPALTKVSRVRSWLRGKLTAAFPDCFGVIAGKRPLDIGFVLRVASGIIEEILDGGHMPLRLDSYRINGEMGTATALIRGENTLSGFALKLPLHDRGAEELLREARFFEQHNLANTPLARLSTMLPRTLKVGEFEGVPYAAFSLLQGKTSNYLMSRGVHPVKLLESVLTFAVDLHEASQSDRVNWDTLGNELIRRAVDAIRDLTASARHKRALESATQWLFEVLGEWKPPVVMGHGDFKLGNCLFDPDSLRVSGVLDWGAGLRSEVPGYDISFACVDWVWQVFHVPLPDALIMWCKRVKHFSKDANVPCKVLSRAGISCDEKIWQFLGVYQWVRRMAPLASRFECRRFDFRYVDSMFDVLVRLGF
jgi:ubiquinone/menaquinone biosynthesis C-methylase UbiE